MTVTIKIEEFRNTLDAFTEKHKASYELAEFKQFVFDYVNNKHNSELLEMDKHTNELQKSED